MGRLSETGEWSRTVGGTTAPSVTCLCRSMRPSKYVCIPSDTDIPVRAVPHVDAMGLPRQTESSADGYTPCDSPPARLWRSNGPSAPAPPGKVEKKPNSRHPSHPGCAGFRARPGPGGARTHGRRSDAMMLSSPGRRKTVGRRAQRPARVWLRTNTTCQRAKLVAKTKEKRRPWEWEPFLRVVGNGVSLSRRSCKSRGGTRPQFQKGA